MAHHGKKKIQKKLYEIGCFNWTRVKKNPGHFIKTVFSDFFFFKKGELAFCKHVSGIIIRKY